MTVKRTMWHKHSHASGRQLPAIRSWHLLRLPRLYNTCMQVSMEPFLTPCEAMRGKKRSHCQSLVLRENHLWKSLKVRTSCGKPFKGYFRTLVRGAWAICCFTAGLNPGILFATSLKSSATYERSIPCVATLWSDSCATRIPFAGV